MKKLMLTTSALLLLSIGAQAQVEPDYNPSKPRTTTPWYGHVNAAQKQADLDFIAGMRPHHAGALTMAEQYLNNTDAENEALLALARGIIRNQTFEIGMLDTVENHLVKITPEGGKPVKAQIATRGLAQQQKFMRAPMPGFRDASRVSAEDVRFAKAMIIHHQAALDMANDYLKNENADNGYLRLLCLDILKDQRQEIAFMQSIVDAYQGDADAIKIDPSMVHGMDGMHHGGTHGSNDHGAQAHDGGHAHH